MLQSLLHTPVFWFVSSCVCVLGILIPLLVRALVRHTKKVKAQRALDGIVEPIDENAGQDVEEEYGTVDEAVAAQAETDGGMTVVCDIRDAKRVRVTVFRNPPQGNGEIVMSYVYGEDGWFDTLQLKENDVFLLVDAAGRVCTRFNDLAPFAVRG